jgi:hypothetical protein
LIHLHHALAPVHAWNPANIEKSQKTVNLSGTSTKRKKISREQNISEAHIKSQGLRNQTRIKKKESRAT